MGRLAAGRYASNKRLSDVSVENAVLDTFSFTSTTQLAPLRKLTKQSAGWVPSWVYIWQPCEWFAFSGLQRAAKAVEERKLPLRTGPDGVVRFFFSLAFPWLLSSQLSEKWPSRGRRGARAIRCRFGGRGRPRLRT